MPPRTRRNVPAPLPSEGVDDALAVLETPDEVIPPVLDDDGRAIPAELTFVTDPDGATDTELSDDDVLELQVDGTVLIAMRPSAEQWGVLMGMMANAATMADRYHAMMTFSATVLDDTSHLYVQRRLLDRDDPFGIEVFDKMLRGIMNAFSPKETGANRAARRAAVRKLRR